jgi:hypothetical protein
MSKLMAVLIAALVGLSWVSSGFAQGNLSSGSVVVGQDVQGRNVMLMVLPLKHLDPAVAAQLFGGSIITGGGYGAAAGGQTGGYGGGYNQRPTTTTGRRGSAANQQGYGGYQDAQRRNNQYPGYQSPYDYR